MPMKSQPGGSTEELPSTKPQKRTTKKAAAKRVPKAAPPQDVASAIAVNYWDAVKEKVFDRTIGSKNIDSYIRAANPRSPEDRTWWDTNGSLMVADWIRFREWAGWQIWNTPDGTPAIEIELAVDIEDTFIKMAIDRVMVTPSGELTIVDLKTGKRNPQSTLQLGFYRYGLKKKFGIEINTGHYWMARQAVMSDPIDLSSYTDEKIEYLVAAFDRARKAHSFIPNTSNCGMCGYTKHCIWYTKETKSE